MDRALNNKFDFGGNMVKLSFLGCNAVIVTI